MRHPARFVLIGSGNPEEGELRPQLLDRFGLAVDVKTPTDIPARIEVVRRRDAFERDPRALRQGLGGRRAQAAHAGSRRRANASAPSRCRTKRWRSAARLCVALGADGLRGELTLLRAARALASLEGVERVGDAQLRRVAPFALGHRLRRNPLDDIGSATRVARAIEEIFGA